MITPPYVAPLGLRKPLNTESIAIDATTPVALTPPVGSVMAEIVCNSCAVIYEETGAVANTVGALYGTPVNGDVKFEVETQDVLGTIRLLALNAGETGNLRVYYYDTLRYNT